MFVEVEFQTPGGAGEELVVPEAALQRLGERVIVFVVEEDEPGRFKVHDVEVGATSGGFTRVRGGLQAGARVVTAGSFTLKSHLLKGELGGDEH
jgi:multidrug efflux pump subunit AcrA (membrane-fusion protein)